MQVFAVTIERTARRRLPALAALPGAMRLASGLKFAGISSRVVALPFSTVFEGPGV